MGEFTIIFVLGVMCVLGFCFFCFVMVAVTRYRNRVQKELSGQPGIYKGPAGEPRWDGELPAKADDYVRPRYVYENLVESTDYLPENGRVIGYRISPSLVIHSRVQYDVNPSALISYVRRLGGKLLTPDDVLKLWNYWQDVSALRVNAGDRPLGEFHFWCCSEGGLPVCASLDDGHILFKDVIGFAGFYASLILKR